MRQLSQVNLRYQRLQSLQLNHRITKNFKTKCQFHFSPSVHTTLFPSPTCMSLTLEEMTAHRSCYWPMSRSRTDLNPSHSFPLWDLQTVLDELWAPGETKNNCKLVIVVWPADLTAYQHGRQLELRQWLWHTAHGGNKGILKPLAPNCHNLLQNSYSFSES